MSPHNPRREAFEILKRVEEAGAFASVLLAHRAPVIGAPRDVALVHELVLGVLRRQASIDHAIGRAANRPADRIDAPVRIALRIGAYSLLYLERIPSFAAVDTAVDLVKDAGWAKAAGFANGTLRRIARERAALLPPAPAPGDTEALALFHSHPAWWTRRAVERLGWDAASALLAADNEPAATVIAAPVSEGDPDEFMARLNDEGAPATPCRFARGAWRTVSGIPQHTPVFRESCWIQDEASQLAVGLFGETVGPRVLDACAAPGGKTLLLASRLAAGGLVVAVDRHVRRLSRLTENVARLGATDVAPMAADMSRETALAADFDDVLVDAPCSGTGTLRRHPEIRWRLTEGELPGMAARQRAILDRAAERVRPGGRLVYSVCSFEPEEGEQVVASFLAEHPDFTRADPRPGLIEPARSLIGPDLALRTSPCDDGMDGFFASLLTRPTR